MKLSMLMKVGTVVVAGLAMAACSHSNNNGSETQYKTAMNGTNSSNGATAYGVGADSSFQTAQSSRGGMHVNSLTAPSNQTYYFSFDSNQIKSSDMRALEAQANYLASHPNARIRLEGNTDNRGSREYNVALGWRRDQAVDHFFTERGVSPKQIQMVSYGKEHPAVTGNTPQDWALNRRVNLIYKG